MSWFILDASGSGLKLKMSFAPGIRNLLWRDASVPLVSASEVGLMFLFFHEQFRDFTGGSAVTNLPAMQETWRHMSNLWARKIPWRRKWQPASVFLPGESHGQRGVEGYSPWGLKGVRHNWATKQRQKTVLRTPSLPLSEWLSGESPCSLSQVPWREIMWQRRKCEGGRNQAFCPLCSHSFSSYTNSYYKIFGFAD